MIKSFPIPARYQAEPLSEDFKEGWLAWSLDFFTQPTPQVPYLDITLQLDITEAYRCYEMEKERGSGEGGTLFAFLVWHLAQTLARHPSFNLRWVDGVWYRLKNPPIFIPVAIGGKLRFSEVVLEDIYNQDYGSFIENYTRLLNQARNGGPQDIAASSVFHLAHFMGNIPYLRFSGLTLHWRAEQMIGQSCFYFGQRYREGEKLLIPLAVKLHHACADPFVLNELLQEWQGRFKSGSWLTG